MPTTTGKNDHYWINKRDEWAAKGCRFTIVLFMPTAPIAPIVPILPKVHYCPLDLGNRRKRANPFLSPPCAHWNVLILTCVCVAAGDVCVRLHRDNAERHFANRAGGESDGAHAMGETSNDDKCNNGDKRWRGVEGWERGVAIGVEKGRGGN